MSDAAQDPSARAMAEPADAIPEPDGVGTTRFQPSRPFITIDQAPQAVADPVLEDPLEDPLNDADTEVPHLSPGSPPEARADFREAFESLATVVLDAADVASSAASAASQTGTDMLAATTRLRETEQLILRRSNITLASLAAVTLLAVTITATAGYVMTDRVQRLDETLLAVGKRTVELGMTGQSLEAGSDTLKAVGDQVAGLLAAQEAIRTMQAQLETKVDTALKQAEATMQQVPDRTAKQVAASSDGVNRQLQALGGRLQAQAGAMQTLTRDVKELSTTVAAVDALRRDLQSLNAAQRARAAEPAPTPKVITPPAPPPTPREPMLQYPRPQQGKDKPTAAPAG